MQLRNSFQRLQSHALSCVFWEVGQLRAAAITIFAASCSAICACIDMLRCVQEPSCLLANCTQGAFGNLVVILCCGHCALQSPFIEMLAVSRHLEIGRESHKLIDAKVQQSGLEVVSEPYQFGEVLEVYMCSHRHLAFACDLLTVS